MLFFLKVFSDEQLSHVRIIRESIEESGKVFLALYLEFRNACILFLSEESERLGTLAVSIPARGALRKHLTSSVLLGERDILAARLLAEKLANLTEKIALVSVSTRTVSQIEVAQTLLRLMEKVLAKGRS